VPVAQKKTAISRKHLPRVGGKGVLEKLPPGLIDGLPEEDQKAISVIVGVPIRLSGYDEDGRLELEFVEGSGTIHSIYVDRKYVKATKTNSRKSKRRK
jgi:hypothetical protein